MKESEKIYDIDARRLALEEELKQLEDDIDSSLGEVKKEVKETISLKNVVQKHPLLSLGGAVLAGFLFSYKSNSSSVQTHSTGFKDSLIREVKREIGKKALNASLEILRKKLDDLGER